MTALTYEYASATYGVGLDGLHVPDEEALNSVVAQGWEPVQMTSVHNGFAVLVLFRREAGTSRPAKTTPAKASAAKATAAKASAAKATKATQAVPAKGTPASRARAR